MILSPPQEQILSVLDYAFKEGASDVHIEPGSLGVVVRLRIDGVLEKCLDISYEEKDLFLDEAKGVFGFDMSLSGVPQDSSFSHPTVDVDVRGNIIFTQYGEKICLRLLERNKKFSLENYPLFQKAKSLLFDLTQKKQGLILTTGPTGSGKSTLLFSILGSCDFERKNIYTLEQPIEYTIDGINQCPIGGDVDFPMAIRALMRQDPDIIMIGEIRDKETCEAAIHAANTGHLVLSTAHTNSAEEVFSRFEALGVGRGLITPTILIICAQRLAKKICVNCAEEDEEGKKFIEEKFGVLLTFTPKKSRGCKKCNGRGVLGRILIFEYIQGVKEGSQNIMKKVGSLKEDIFLKLEEGVIDAQEAYALCSS